jgi:hypothetical protein
LRNSSRQGNKLIRVISQNSILPLPVLL